MSSPNLPESPPPFSPQGSGCLPTLFLVAGALLLLPGGCVILLFVLGYVTHPEPAFFRPTALLLFGGAVLISVIGVVLIRLPSRWRQ